MKLSEVSSKYGAPMGRREHGAGGLDDVVFEVEWVPFTDGCYDAGGVYWGMPDNLHCAIGMLDDEEVAVHYLRAADRDEAIAMLQLEYGYEDSVILPENGSLIRQMIDFLKAYQSGLGPDDEWAWQQADDDISDLYMLLEDKGLV